MRGKRWSIAGTAPSPAGKKTSLPYLELPVPVKEELPCINFFPQFPVLGPEEGAGPCYRPLFTTQIGSKGKATSFTSPPGKARWPPYQDWPGGPPGAQAPGGWQEAVE